MSVPGHVFLVGFMGAGKSTVGRLVAERLGRRFVDTDDLIVRQEGKSIAELFADGGEEAFREVETSVLQSLRDEPSAIVACGGGIVLAGENRALLRQLGEVVYLRVNAGEALARIGDSTTRPLLSGPAGGVVATTILAARESLYASVADISIDTMGVTALAVADTVVHALEEVE